MSSARQTVMRGPNLIGLGNLPSRTPAHQVDFPTGMGPPGMMISLMRRRRLAFETSVSVMLMLQRIKLEQSLVRPPLPLGEVDKFLGEFA
jgi:hypothetical protein